MAIKVAFCRPLILGAKGKDVIAHKRAISRAAPDIYPWMGAKFTPIFGGRFETAVVRYQKRRGITPASGKIGRGTHEDLEKSVAKNKPTEPAFDPLAVKMAAEFCGEFEKTTREKVVEAGFYWYSRRSQISYSQARPFALGVPLWIPDQWDCSGFVTACYYAGEAGDPNNRNFDGHGYTGTLISNGVKIAQNALKPGDLIFYGFTRVAKPGFPIGSPTHVAMYVGDGMVLSNGSYPMGYYHYNYRSDLNHFRSYSI